MGSSPVTATTSPAEATSLEASLDDFLRGTAGWRPGAPLVVAYSGGSDSTALLAASVQVAGKRTPVWAAHYDHSLDSGSAERALAARSLAAQIGARWTSERAERPTRTPHGLEAWARRRRYAFLDHVRRRVGAPAVLTAHHRRDQAETVLLRILLGSGLRGLAAVQPWIGRIGRPWLDIDPGELQALVAAGGWTPVEDPTNHDLSLPRNLLRHALLPRLLATDPAIEQRLAGLAVAARRTRLRVGDRLASALDLQPRGEGAGSLSLSRLRQTPPDLWPFALASLHQPAGLASAPGPRLRQRQLAELQRQLDAGEGADVCLESGWRWSVGYGRLRLQPPTAFSSCDRWSRRLDRPGAVKLPDGGRMTLEAAAPESWMRRGDPLRTGIELPPEAQVGVRSRRPGDMLQPLGCAYRRKLKEVLIDAKVAADDRDRLPLLLVDGMPAWVPGVTLDHRFRVRGKFPLWLAQWHPGRRN